MRKKRQGQHSCKRDEGETQEWESKKTKREMKKRREKRTKGMKGLKEEKEKPLNDHVLVDENHVDVAVVAVAV